MTTTPTPEGDAISQTPARRVCEDSMSAVDLLPCPFCGGTSITDEAYWIASPVEWFGKFKCNDCDTDGPLSEFKYDDRAEAVEDARAMWNRRAPVSAEKVRKLVWEHAADDALSHDEWVASALGGAFHMAPDEDSASGGWLLQWTIRHEDFCMAYGGAITEHPGPEAAKAAAQADYEARILSALSQEGGE